MMVPVSFQENQRILIIVQMVDIAEVFSRNNLTEVGCLKINIEGGEYALLERMIDVRLTARVRGLLIQFHSFVEGAGRLHSSIQVSLAATHNLTWNFPFIWEYWVRKPEKQN